MTPEVIRFHAAGIEGSEAVICVASARRPQRVSVGGKAVKEEMCRFADGLLWVRFMNVAGGTDLEITRGDGAARPTSQASPQVLPLVRGAPHASAHGHWHDHV